MCRIRKILLIDDDKDLLLLLEMVLKKHGYKVVVSDDGSNITSIIEKEDPDLVFLDIMLPSKNGWEVCKEIKEQYSHIPVVFLSILSDPDEIRKSYDAGGVAHIPKPFKYKEIINFIESFESRMQAN